MTLQPPPGFPLCPEQQPSESIPEYASRVLRFLLDCQTTASLTDDQLTQADHAAQLAIAQIKGQDGRASSIDPIQARTITILSAARHTALSALGWRRTRERHAEVGPTPPPQPGAQPGRPAPLQPPIPSLPPSGMANRPARSPSDGIRF